MTIPDTVRPKELFGKLPRRSPEQFEFIRYRIDGPVARLTLHRPEHNLLNESMLRELADGIGSLTEKGSVKLIVLDADGKVFSGGVDIGEYTAERAFSMLDAFRAAGNHYRSVSSACIHDVSSHHRAETRAGTCVDRRSHHGRAGAGSGPREPPGARCAAPDRRERTDRQDHGSVWRRAGHGQESRYRRDGTFLTRGPAQLHEHFSE